MSELKPCPFCGKEILMDGTVYNINTHGEPRVYCANCGATGPNDVSYGRADEMWNLRRPEDALRARIAELEAAARWIPVEERLPGVDEANVVSGKKSVSITVIAIDKFEHATRAFCFLEDYEGIYKKGDWYSLDKMQAVNKIAYWMPLPQPSAVQE